MDLPPYWALQLVNHSYLNWDVVSAGIIVELQQDHMYCLSKPNSNNTQIGRFNGYWTNLLIDQSRMIWPVASIEKFLFDYNTMSNNRALVRKCRCTITAKYPILHKNILLKKEGYSSLYENYEEQRKKKRVQNRYIIVIDLIEEMQRAQAIFW